MAQFTCPVSVDISDPEHFIGLTLGNGYTWTGLTLQPDPIGDYLRLLNYQLGVPSPYANFGSFGTPAEGWTDSISRGFNSSKGRLTYNESNLQYGDVVFLSGGGDVPTGGVVGLYIQHDGEAIRIAYQHGTNRIVEAVNFNRYTFLGGFTPNVWLPPDPPTPPTPTVTEKHRFPWAAVTRKIRTNRR